MLQHEVRGAHGELLAILDFWWPGIGLAGEFDGWGTTCATHSYWRTGC